MKFRTQQFLKTLQFGLEELKFLRSFKDMKFLYQKLSFLFPRVTGNFIREKNVPPSLQLEPTNHCNLKCISCPRDRIEREKGFIDFNLFQKIIDDASEIGVKRIHLYLHGEPLLHPQITAIINYIKLKGLGINMVTNGLLLDKKKIEAILCSGVNSADYITFSILGCSKEVHEKVMRGVSHERVVENILNFLRLRKIFKINGPIIETIFYKMPENEHEEIHFIKKWKNVVDHVHTVGKISKSFANFKIEDRSIPLRNKTCKNIWERMTIYWNGDATVCCEDVDGNHILGNLREKSIKDIWNCEKLLSLKRLHRENNVKNIRLCSKCDQ
jgi:radical SAM protein with 4Fe4S-binding SPASM domain